MLADVIKHAQKAGKPPGSLIYTGEKLNTPRLTLISYDGEHCQTVEGNKLSDIKDAIHPSRKTWIDVEGLSNIEMITDIKALFNLHSLTVEDILNIEQRAKIEEFNDYLFVTLKMLFWDDKSELFRVEQLSLVLGENYMLSFTETRTSLLEVIMGNLQAGSVQRLRVQGIDYLFYRVLDTVIDQYFIVLEEIGEQIGEIESLVIASPKQQQAHMLYNLKRQTIMLRRAIWPMREVINHISQTNEQFISSFTRLYLRDVYDHTMQAIDSIDTYRDMLASILDIYLSSLSNRMNEVMKTLTVISTIFIPITFIASIYGMNFPHIPEFQYPGAYPIALCVMGGIAIAMLIYFKTRKWF